MWTVRKIRVGVADPAGARNAARYPLEPGDSPRAYRAGGADGAEAGPMAYWLGSEAALAKLGLEPGQEVTQKDLALALQGRGTDGGQVRRPGFIERQVRGADGELRRERELGVVSYDMTFSAPKSVSVLWSQADEGLKTEIERAMFESWNTATEHLIASHDVVMQGRAKGERPYGPAAGFAAAASLHATARRAEGEEVAAPQLHLHGLLVALARSDGKLAAINSAAIYGDPALEAGAYARALLAQRLAEMGFEIESGTGRDGFYFEVRGVPKELIAKWSARTREIEAAALAAERERGYELSKRERAQLALLTRLAKEEGLGPAETAEVWRLVNEAGGFGAEAIAAMRGEPGYRLDPKSAHEDLLAAVEKGMRKRGPTVSRAAARAVVMAAAPGRVTFAEADAMIDRLQSEDLLVALAEGRVTTRSIRIEEQEVMASVEAVARRPREALSAPALAAGRDFADRALGEGRELSPEQKKAITELTQGAGWSVLTAPAGAGKTAVLQAVAEAHRQEGFEILACAIEWDTAGELAEDLGSEAFSIRNAVNLVRAGKIKVTERTLIVIEEAGKVGLPQWHQLATLVRATGARVLAVGHAAQMGAPELPGMFEELVERASDLFPLAGLSDIKRHKYKWMRELQIAIEQGRGDDAVRILDKHDAISFHPTKEAAAEATVADWFKARSRDDAKRATMIVQGSNEEIDQVNARAQARLRDEGLLEGPSVASSDRPYGFYVGDQVVLRGAAYYFEPEPDGERERTLANGTAGVVRRVDPPGQRFWVEVKEPGHDPRVVEIDLARTPKGRDGKPLSLAGAEDFGPPSWRLAYAIHPYVAQGMTIYSVSHLGGHWAQDRESSYVALSRMIAELRDHVNCERFQGETRKEWLEEYAKVLKTSRRLRASIHYEEEPDWKVAAPAAIQELPEAIDLGPAERPEPGERSLAERLTERLDPLAPHRGVLGEERSRWITERAGLYAEAVEQMDEITLRGERDAYREAFERLDREGALRTLALQRERFVFEKNAEEARNQAETLRWQAEEMRGRGQRSERKAMEAIAKAQGRQAAEDERSAAERSAAERELHRKGAHLDGWMRDDGDAAARYVALERRLFERRSQALAEEIEASLREPPEHILATLGPAPALEDPEREEWEELAYELEAGRLISEDQLIAAEPSARELQGLGRRIEGLRERRAQEPQLGGDSPRLEAGG